MSEKTIGWIIKSLCGVLLLLLGAGIWYYTMGRKPHLLISAPIKPDEHMAVVRAVGPNETVLLVGTKATLYDFTLGHERWTASTSGVAPAAVIATAAAIATPAPKPATKPAAAAPVAEEKPDPLVTARVKKHFAKLEKWAAELNDKRTKIKTQLQLDSYTEEAAKYRAELAAAQAEAAPLHHTEAAVAIPTAAEAALVANERFSRHDEETFGRVEIVALDGSIWIAQGHRVTGLDRADGHLLKSATLTGAAVEFLRGNDEVFAVSRVGEGRQAQVTRFTATAAPQSFNLDLPPEPAAEASHEGSPVNPPTPGRRIVFRADRGSLLQADVHLTQRKLTERQTMTGEPGSDLEAADKKTTGGFGNDATTFALALSRESERDATGGKEIIDESTYEVTLRRPFATTLPAATVEVHGHVEIFATPNLDLVVAGKDLVAFDHSNKKLWQAQLAQPISATTLEAVEDDEAIASRPCFENGDRLYFFDPTYLTALTRQTGQPAWRLPLKNIRKLQLDSAGHLYVATQASEIGTTSELLQLDAQTGRVLWKVEKYDDCFISGKDVYASRETHNSEDVANSVFDRSKAVQCRWKLYKLSARNGEPQWDWFQTRRPSRIEADHKRVSLLFADELQVLTSIAL